MKSFISPNFTHEKLDNPTYEGLIDVFEDAFRNRMLKSAKYLLEMTSDNNNMPCGDISAVALMTSYFEGIEFFLQVKVAKANLNRFLKVVFQEYFRQVKQIVKCFRRLLSLYMTKFDVASCMKGCFVAVFFLVGCDQMLFW